MSIQELAVEGFLRKDRGAILRAVALDPLDSASVTLEAMEEMVDGRFEARVRWVDGYAWRLPSTRARPRRPQPPHASGESGAQEAKDREPFSV